MVIIIHSETNKSNIQNLGRPEYSYYFVLKEFRPVLERIGQVIEVSNPDELVDRLYFDCLSRGEECVYLSFSPPHRTPIHYACPTIPVFAWEFSTIPTESWQGEPRHDWRVVLEPVAGDYPFDIHGQHRARCDGRRHIRLRDPAPVWDRFAAAVSIWNDALWSSRHAEPAWAADRQSHRRLAALWATRTLRRHADVLCRAGAGLSVAARRRGLHLSVQSLRRAQELAGHDQRVLHHVPRHSRCDAGAETHAPRHRHALPTCSTTCTRTSPTNAGSC